MSTLTSSPSPVPSPRSSIHLQRPGYPSYPFSTAAPAASPKQRSLHASPVQQAQGSAAGARQPRAQFVESPRVEKTWKYQSTGTQYSPEGYPPTVNRTPAAKESSTKKRKEPARSPDSMSTPSSESTSAIPSRPPTEPEPRRDPTPAPTTTSSQQHGDGPQEARSTHGHSAAPKRSRPEPGTTKVMPILYQYCDAKDLGHLIANMLMELIRINDQIPLNDGKLTRFHSRAPPGISVSDYLQRLIHHATLSPPILLSIVYYIDRLCAEYSAFTINSLTVHRFLITAATVAAKGLSDSFWTNPTYAKIGGIPTTELATLELEFLQKVKWLIVPKPDVLVDYYRGLVDRDERYELDVEVEAGNSGSASTSVPSTEDGDEDNMEATGDGDEVMKDDVT